MHHEIALRIAQPADIPFLADVYASTRTEELALVDWDDAAKQAFLSMQFRAQHQHYHTYFAEADFDVILVDAQPVGRLYVDRTASELLLIDIALLPSSRGQGIGTRLMRDLLAEATAAGLPVRLHVEPQSPARRLYERLGFTVVPGHDEDVLNLYMEWLPPRGGDGERREQISGCLTVQGGTHVERR